MFFSSQKTDPRRSNPSYYASVIVENGRITEIRDENYREGGVVWTPTFEYNGDLQCCMDHIARDFPNLYKKVQKEATLNRLDKYSVANRTNVRHDLGQVDFEIKRLKNRLKEKEREARKLRAQLK